MVKTIKCYCKKRLDRCNYCCKPLYKNYSICIYCGAELDERQIQYFKRKWWQRIWD